MNAISDSGRQPEPASERDAAREVTARLQGAGFEAYWVGGCVRDLLLGREPSDYDVSTSATPDEIENLFEKTIPVGRQFGVMVVIENGCQIQVATFRAEADYHDGRHPSTVTFSNAKADAQRRDFTVNGLFHDPVKGETHDWVGGRADIERKLIRTIGSPEERFSEDHLRLLRAARFAAQLGFVIEPETMDSVRRNASKIRTVSPERIRDELLKLFHPSHALVGLDLLKETGLLEHVLPEMMPLMISEQSPEHHPEGTVYEHVRLMLKLMPPDADPLLPWAVLLHDIAKPDTFSKDPVTGRIHNYGHEKVGAVMAETILTRLRFPRKQVDTLVSTVRNHMRFRNVPDMRKATLRRMLLHPDFDFDLQLHRLDCLGSHSNLDSYELLIREREQLAALPQIIPPLISGHDLAGLGMKPGSQMGQLLAEIRDKQLQEELTSREQALKFAREKLNIH